MFFEKRIKSIRDTDRVLEIGPGATPFWRSDVFLEKIYHTKEEYIAQAGHIGELSTDKQVIFYEGDNFPFEDKEFDYVICSHVLEHVDNPEQFIRKIQRVAKGGYLEFSTLYYDFICNFPEHHLMLNLNQGIIRWMTKADSGISQYKNIQSFFYRTCELECYSLINELKEYFFAGFEWTDRIVIQKANSLDELCYDAAQLSSIKRTLNKEQKSISTRPTIKTRVKNKLIQLLQQW